MKTRLVSVFVLALGVGGLAACGDDGDDSASRQIQTDADGLVPDVDDGDIPDIGTDSGAGEDGGSNGAPTGPTGSAVAVIGGETFEFDVECAFGPDTGRPDDGILAMGGSGDGDLRLHVSSTSSDADDADATPFDSIDVNDGDTRYAAANLPMLEQPGFLVIDGRSISATTEFVDERTDTFVEGTFEATCP